MIITKEIKVYSKIIKIENLAINSHKKVMVKCDNCGNIKEVKYQSYNKSTNNNTEKFYCNNKECVNKKRKIVIQEKYNVDNISQLQFVKNKKIKTSLDNYGVEYPIQSEKIKEKIKTINNKNFGEDWITQTDNFKKKSKITNLKRYGTENAMQSKQIKNKSKNTNLEKYNSDFYIQSDIFKKIVKNRKIILLSEKYNLKIQDIKDDNIISICGLCNKNFEANYQLLYNRFLAHTTLCTKCNTINSPSNCEIQLQIFIKENYNDNISLNNREIIKPYELDVFLPKLNIAFEFNGLYWHNELNKDKKYHLNKTEKCEKLDIQLIHIWEDDWIYKQDIVKSMILNKLGKSTNRIYARKTIVKEVTDNKLIRGFLNKNHIQGFVGSSVKIGLFYDDELVSLMTFGKTRKIMNSISINNEYEMYRFCNKLNTNIIGGVSKLFKYFLCNYNFDKIVSYVDRSYFNGNNYLKLGFELDGKTTPNYYYIVGRKREYRFKFRKDILVKEGYNINNTEHEIMLKRNIFRIYNSGNFKMIYINK